MWRFHSASAYSFQLVALFLCIFILAAHVVNDQLPARTGIGSVKVLDGSFLGSIPDIQLPCVMPWARFSLPLSSFARYSLLLFY